MQTQRDHVHAHQFQMARMSSALLLGDPSMAENPMRRTVFGLSAGIIVGVLVVVCFGVYGWIVPGGNVSWRKGSSIIVEKETGTRYIYANGKLFPTLNLASAMILSGGSNVRLVSRKSLAGVPRGAPIGIPNAPQVLPAGVKDMVHGPWLACLGGSIAPSAADQIGVNLDPGATAVELPPGRFMLVGGGGKDYLIWRGQKHLIGDPSIPVALGATNAVSIPAPVSWLDMVPSGADLDVPAIPGSGSATVAVDGHEAKVGALFTQATTTGGQQLFVLRKEGLAPVNQTMLQVLQAAHGTQPVALDAAAVAATPRSRDRSLSTPFAELSASAWQDGAGLVLCQRQTPAGKDTIDSRVVLTAQSQAGLDENGKATVRLRSGTGMVVYPVPRTSSTVATDPYLIAEQGLRYHLTDKDAAKALGLDDGYQVPFPRTLLEALPSGPALSRTAVVTEPEG